MGRHVPEGWFDYSRFGSPIDTTRIVAVKTPLKKYFNTGRPAVECGDYTKILGGVPIEEEFTPGQMVELFEKKGWRVGLVIDLTFTHRYYDPQEFIDHGVGHVKIKCPGQVIPPDDIYHRMSAEISEFLSDPSNDDKLIAVHCTHGLNRTGYLVCRYLMENCNYDADSAIEAFNKGRGSDIERKNYLQHLRDGCPKDTKEKQPLSKSPDKIGDCVIVPSSSSSSTGLSRAGLFDSRHLDGRRGHSRERDWVDGRRYDGSSSWRENKMGDLRAKISQQRVAPDTDERRGHYYHSRRQDYGQGGGGGGRREELGEWKGRLGKRARYEREHNDRDDYFRRDDEYASFERRESGGRREGGGGEGRREGEGGGEGQGRREEGGGGRGHYDSWSYQSHDTRHYNNSTPYNPQSRPSQPYSHTHNSATYSRSVHSTDYDDYHHHHHHHHHTREPHHHHHHHYSSSSGDYYSVHQQEDQGEWECERKRRRR